MSLYVAALLLCAYGHAEAAQKAPSIGKAAMHLFDPNPTFTKSKKGYMNAYKEGVGALWIDPNFEQGAGKRYYGNKAFYAVLKDFWQQVVVSNKGNVKYPISASGTLPELSGGVDSPVIKNIGRGENDFTTICLYEKRVQKDFINYVMLVGTTERVVAAIKEIDGLATAIARTTNEVTQSLLEQDDNAFNEILVKIGNIVRPPSAWSEVSSTFSEQSTVQGRITELFQGFTLTTSAHGLPYIGLGPTRCAKVFWALVTCGALSAFIWQINLLATQFASDARTMEMVVDDKDTVFPAVTLCNINPYLTDHIAGDPQLKNIMDMYTDSVQNIREKTSKKLVTSNKQHLNASIERQKRLANESLDISDNIAYWWCELYSDHSGGGKALDEYTRCDSNDTAVCLCGLTEDNPTQCHVFHDQSHPNPWRVDVCRHGSNHMDCTDGGGKFCHQPLSTVNQPTDDNNNNSLPCICHKQIEKDDKFCIIVNETTVQEVRQAQAEKSFDGLKSKVHYKCIFRGIEQNETDGYLIAQRAQDMVNTVIATEKTVEEKATMSTKLTDFVESCSFDSIKCDMIDDFDRMVHTIHGTCFTFNRKGKRTYERSGPKHGLQLKLYSNVNSYIQTTQSAGVRFILHHHDYQPYPDMGKDASTGYHTSVGVRIFQEKIARMRSSVEERDCATNDSGHFHQEDYLYQEPYTREGCFRSCYQMKVYRLCNCSHVAFPPYPSNESRVCPANANEITKEQTCIKELTWKPSECYHCAKPCVEYQYRQSISLSKWPVESARVLIPQCQMKSEGTSDSPENCTRRYRMNGLSLVFYLEEVGVRVMQERSKYTTSDLLAGIGGNLGLWLGVSAITILEIVILGMHMVLSLCPFWSWENGLAPWYRVQHQFEEMEEELDRRRSQSAATRPHPSTKTNPWFYDEYPAKAEDPASARFRNSSLWNSSTIIDEKTKKLYPPTAAASLSFSSYH